MESVVELKQVRKQRLVESLPCRETVYGKQYCFSVSYEYDGGRWGFDLWAFSEDDAKKRVEAIRATAKQTYIGVAQKEEAPENESPGLNSCQMPATLPSSDGNT